MSRLLIEASNEFVVGDFSEEGRRYYLAQLAPAKLEEKLGSPEYRFCVAEVEGLLAGVAAMRGAAHLYYLFVAKPFHRRDVARRLWEVLKAEAKTRGAVPAFTVNASLFAVEAYKRLGFVPLGPHKELNGIRYVPMAAGGLEVGRNWAATLSHEHGHE